MKDAKILGKIIALTKCYHSREVADSFVRRFSARYVGLSWWLTRKGAQTRDELARMIISRLNHLPLDIETVVEAIEETLQKNADNREILQSSWFTEICTMFDGRAGSAGEFATKLWSILQGAVVSTVTDWLVVAPLLKISSPSIEVGCDGLTLINATDLDAWRSVSADFQRSSRWNPRTGVTDDSDPNVYGSIPPDLWAVCRTSGTERGANKGAFERIKTLVALLFAFSPASLPWLLIRTRDEGLLGYNQFAALSSTGRSAQLFGCVDGFVPLTFAKIEVTPALLSGVQSWYSRRESASDEMSRRASVASQFLHFGFMADGIERFIHFFVVLDALFGVRGSVESSIVTGVEQLFAGDRAWLSRIRHLVDLRNELIHGGSSSIEMWSGYSGYVRHFRSTPMDDIATASTVSLRRFFEL